MGLDQYAYARKNDATDGENDILFAQWRKHADLEGWMADLYQARGGVGDFNCVELQLFKSDLEKLKNEHTNLKRSQGFFWGQSYPEDIESTREFIESAFSYLEGGYKIIYTSWW